MKDRASQVLVVAAELWPVLTNEKEAEEKYTRLHNSPVSFLFSSGDPGGGLILRASWLTESPLKDSYSEGSPWLCKNDEW